MDSMMQNRVKFMEADADRRIQTAFKDRLPESSKIAFNDQDHVIFYNNKLKKKSLGVIIGFDGSTAYVTSGQSVHKVPTRELLHNTVKRVLDEDQENTSEKESSDSGTDGSISDCEEIQEIIPTRKRRKRKTSEDLTAGKSEKDRN